MALLCLCFLPGVRRVLSKDIIDEEGVFNIGGEDGGWNSWFDSMGNERVVMMGYCCLHQEKRSISGWGLDVGKM